MAFSITRLLSPWTVNDSVIEIIRRILLDRVSTVSTLITLAPPAIQSGIAEPELIHQIRVATRRCESCLMVCSTLIPPDAAKSWTQLLKSIRQKAGLIRDLDVLICRLENLESTCPGLPDVVGKLKQKRDESYRVFASWLQDSVDSNLLWQMGNPGPDLRWSGDGIAPIWGVAAWDLFRPVMVDYLNAGKKLSKTSRRDCTVETLHSFRIRGKRVRYALEICASGLPVEMAKKLNKRLARIQNHLGRMNDHSAAATILGNGMELTATPRLREALQELKEQEQAATKFEVEKFHEWYSSGQHNRLAKIWKKFHPLVKQECLSGNKK